MGLPSIILQQLHRISTAACQRVIQVDAPARCVVYGTDGAEILCGHEDGIPRLWDASHFTLAREFASHHAPVVSVSGRGSRWVTGSSNGVVRVWASWGELVHSLDDELAAACWAVALNQQGNLLLCGHEDQSARLWDADRGALLKRMRMPVSRAFGVRAVAFGPEDVQVALMYGGGALLWEGGSEAHSALFQIGDAKFEDDRHVCLAFSRDRRLLAAAVRDHNVHLCHWDEPVSILRGHTDLVTSLAFSPEGRFLMTGSEDCTAKIWDTTTRELVVTINDHVGAVWGVAFHPHGHDAATVSEDGTLRIYELTSEWFDIRDAIDQGLRVLDGKRTPLWPTTAPLDLDFVLDVWADIRRRARHVKLSNELTERGEKLRNTVLELLALLCADATPALPMHGLARYKHPLFRVALADLRLATDLCVRLGGDAVAQANLARLQRVPTMEAAAASMIPPRGH